jgi:hypothetical protein
MKIAIEYMQMKKTWLCSMKAVLAKTGGRPHLAHGTKL